MRTVINHALSEMDTHQEDDDDAGRGVTSLIRRGAPPPTWVVPARVALLSDVTFGPSVVRGRWRGWTEHTNAYAWPAHPHGLTLTPSFRGGQNASETTL
jgi:hypothetical protein